MGWWNQLRLKSVEEGGLAPRAPTFPHARGIGGAAMSAVVQATCPGCKQVLRIPLDWLNQPFRCKHCRTIIQARGPQPAPAPAPSTPTPPPRPRVTPPALPVAAVLPPSAPPA